MDKLPRAVAKIKKAAERELKASGEARAAAYDAEAQAIIDAARRRRLVGRKTRETA